MEKTAAGKFKILDGSSLKLIASVLMLANHAANSFVSITGRIIVFSFGSYSLDLCNLIFYISRICFPIYAFLLVEGFIHTHDRRKYGMNLFLFALISEIPWNLRRSGTIFYEKQNVMFTLLFGYLGLCAIEKYKEDRPKQLIALIVLLMTATFFNADYGVTGFGFILLLYALRDNRILQAIIGCTLLSGRWIAGMAFIPINMYSGKRGFARGRIWKYVFYIFYPLHLLLLFLLRYYTIGY